MKNTFSDIPCLHSGQITLRKITPSDADGLRELVNSPSVYRYLPTYLYEKKYPDTDFVIAHLYDECLEESLILGVFEGNSFCGLAEMYGYRPLPGKVSVGYRLLERCWGRGIATKTLHLMTEYLIHDKEIKVITASTMTANSASENVLRKNDFTRILHDVPENWGYGKPTIADKWIRQDHTGLWKRYQLHSS